MELMGVNVGGGHKTNGAPPRSRAPSPPAQSAGGHVFPQDVCLDAFSHLTEAAFPPASNTPPPDSLHPNSPFMRKLAEDWREKKHFH